jgi:proline iminopeptidase
MRFFFVLVAGLSGLVSCAMPLSDIAPGHRIQEAKYLSVGAMDQWVTIRGADDRKPVLLLLHGGPGDVQSPYVTTYSRFEQDFVLVQWDQRGSGRTFAKSGTAGLTLEQQVSDGIDLAQRLRARFQNRKLILLGHSWGSVIATGMAQQRPDLFASYVGTGQVAAWADTVQFQFDFLEQRYRETGNTTGLADLQKIGKPDPLNIAQYFSFSRPLRQNLGPADTKWFAGMKATAMANGETEASIKTAGDGQAASAGALIQSIFHANLPATAPEFNLPYCVIQGRDDLNAPTELARAYFDKVRAPAKAMTVIPDAGHFSLATNQAEFIAALKRCPGVR